MAKKVEELKAVTSSLKETKIEQPSKNFTISVMSRLDQYPSSTWFFGAKWNLPVSRGFDCYWYRICSAFGGSV